MSTYINISPSSYLWTRPIPVLQYFSLLHEMVKGPTALLLLPDQHYDHTSQLNWGTYPTFN